MLSKSKKWSEATYEFKQFKKEISNGQQTFGRGIIPPFAPGFRMLGETKYPSEPVGISEPLNYATTPIHTAQPPTIIGEDAYMFFTKILQFVNNGMTVQQFLDGPLQFLQLLHEDVQIIRDRLMDATIPKEFITGMWCTPRNPSF